MKVAKEAVVQLFRELGFKVVEKWNDKRLAEKLEKLPTIVICYAVISYSSFDLKFLHFNAKTKEGFEIIKALDDDIELSKGDVVKLFDRKVAEKAREIEALKEQREYFLKQFGVYWEKIAVPKEAVKEPF